jgi:hypothetical protein
MTHGDFYGSEKAALIEGRRQPAHRAGRQRRHHHRLKEKTAVKPAKSSTAPS